jgi:predicted nuclease of predicted toxin-antitoxin system
MKLLFDQNLSPHLVHRLTELYPNALHVSHVGLEKASDGAVWDYAQVHECVIVTKDADFGDLSLVRGSPPKILWLRLGNCTTDQVEAILRTHMAVIQEFVADEGAGILTLL